MKIIYYLLFSIIFSITLAYVGRRNSWKVALIIIGLILIFFSGFRDLGVDSDYDSYVTNYLALTNISKIYGIDYTPLTYTEPAFFFISLFVKSVLNNIEILFIIYALLGVSFKLYAIKKLAPGYYIMLPILYFSNYFFLHEMTQIRVGVACGISFASLVPLKRDSKLGFFLLNTCAILFHFSAIIFVFMIFVKDNVSKLRLWIGLVALSLLISVIKFSFFSLIAQIPFLGLFSEKIILYQALADNGYINQINLFNPFILINYGIIISVLCLGKEKINSQQYLPILLKVNIIGLLIFMVCKELPVMSFRLYEYLAFSQIFLIGAQIVFIKEKKAVLCYIGILSLFYLIVNVSILNLLGDYRNILFK